LSRELSDIRLALFFTRGVSLETWYKIGLFEREMALYRRLQRNGIRVTLITYGTAADRTYRELIPGMRILCNRWNLSTAAYEKWLPLLHVLQLFTINIIKTNQTAGADLALRTARLLRKPLIARCGYMWSEFAGHRDGPDADETQRAQKTEALVFSSARRIVVTTEIMAKNIGQRFPALQERITIIPNYVDADLFVPEPGQKLQSEAIFIGRIAAQKNVASLLEAVASLNIRLTIIGEGEEREKLLQRYGDVNGRVRWVNFMPHQEIPRYLNSARLFILPSYYEGHPKALIEAMACGMPVIGTRAPGIQELIRHGETGWLCDTDSASIRQALLKLLGDSELCAHLGNNARAFVVRNFSLDRIVQQELALYQQALGLDQRS
jgi:glycosyltransferase involved in cell wall biosynthesis